MKNTVFTCSLVYLKRLGGTPENLSTLFCSWDKTAPIAVLEKSIVKIKGFAVGEKSPFSPLQVSKFSLHKLRCKDV